MKKPLASSLWKVLGLSGPVKTTSQLRNAYFASVLKMHPDVSKESNAPEKFCALTSAYHTLLREMKASVYLKRYGHNVREQGACGTHTVHARKWSWHRIAQECKTRTLLSDQIRRHLVDACRMLSSETEFETQLHLDLPQSCFTFVDAGNNLINNLHVANQELAKVNKTMPLIIRECFRQRDSTVNLPVSPKPLLLVGAIKLNLNFSRKEKQESCDSETVEYSSSLRIRKPHSDFTVSELNSDTVHKLECISIEYFTLKKRVQKCLDILALQWSGIPFHVPLDLYSEGIQEMRKKVEVIENLAQSITIGEQNETSNVRRSVCLRELGMHAVSATETDSQSIRSASLDSDGTECDLDGDASVSLKNLTTGTVTRVQLDLPRENTTDDNGNLRVVVSKDPTEPSNSRIPKYIVRICLCSSYVPFLKGLEEASKKLETRLIKRKHVRAQVYYLRQKLPDSSRRFFTRTYGFADEEELIFMKRLGGAKLPLRLFSQGCDVHKSDFVSGTGALVDHIPQDFWWCEAGAAMDTSIAILDNSNISSQRFFNVWFQYVAACCQVRDLIETDLREMHIRSILKRSSPRVAMDQLYTFIQAFANSNCRTSLENRVLYEDLGHEFEKKRTQEQTKSCDNDFLCILVAPENTSISISAKGELYLPWNISPSDLNDWIESRPDIPRLEQSVMHRSS